MKTVLMYLVLIAAGFGIGLYGKKLWHDYQGKTVIRDADGNEIEDEPLSDEEETRYRRARTKAYELLDNASGPAQLAGALQEMEKMIELAPLRFEGHLMYSGTGLRLMRWRRGVEVTSEDSANLEIIDNHVRMAARLAPEDFEVMLLTAHWRDYLGQITLERGETEKGTAEIEGALEILDRAVKLHGKDPERFAGLLLERATLLRHLDRNDEALVKLETALKNEHLADQRAIIHLNMALLQDALGDEEAAVRHYDQALKEPKPPVIEILRHRAAFYEKRGYKELAIQDLRFLSRLLPDTPEITEHINELAEGRQR